jgi:hypothetical protein
MRDQLFPRETHGSAYDDQRDAVAISLAADAEALMLVTRELNGRHVAYWPLVDITTVCRSMSALRSRSYRSDHRMIAFSLPLSQLPRLNAWRSLGREQTG